jgi:hypothetical protein
MKSEFLNSVEIIFILKGLIFLVEQTKVSYSFLPLELYFLMSKQVTIYQCLEGGVIAVLQSYIDEDVCEHSCHLLILLLSYSSYVKSIAFL